MRIPFPKWTAPPMPAFFFQYVTDAHTREILRLLRANAAQGKAIADGQTEIAAGQAVIQAEHAELLGLVRDVAGRLAALERAVAALQERES